MAKSATVQRGTKTYRSALRRVVTIVSTVALAAGLTTACAPADETASEGGHVRVGWPLLLDYIDPPLTDGFAQVAVTGNAFERLTRIDADGIVQPLLATEWEAAEDGSYWDVTLRQGVEFTDGVSFNADAVKLNFDRILDESLTVPFRSNFEIIDSVEVVDEYTVRFVTKSPQSGFPNVLAHAASGIISPATLEAHYGGFGNEPAAGTGPFMISESNLPDDVTFVRNDAYWGELAKIDSLTFVSIPDDQARVSALLSGEVDIDMGITGQAVDRVKRDSNFHVFSTPATRAMQWHLPWEAPHFGDIRVRQALNHAVDNDQIIETVYGGAAYLMDSATGPAQSGYVSQDPYEYSPDLVVRLMEDAGWVKQADGSWADSAGEPFPVLEVKAQRNRYPADAQLAEAVTGYLEAAGFVIDLEIMEWATFFETMNNEAAGSGWVIQMSWGSGLSDGRQFLCEKYIRGHHYNYGNYYDAELEQTCAEVSSTFDPEERTALLTKGSIATYENAPNIYLLSFAYQAGASTSIQGLEMHAGEAHSFANVSISR